MSSTVFLNATQSMWIKHVTFNGGGNSNSAEKVFRFQPLFPNSQLQSWRQEVHPVTNNSLEYPWIEKYCLIVTGPLMVKALEPTLVKWYQRVGI